MAYRFIMTEKDHCAYIKRSESKFVILLLYVDDILLAENHIEFFQNINESLFSNFEMKDKGKASYVLGVKIYRDRLRNFLALLQKPYIRRIFQKFKMDKYKPMDTPISKRTNS